MIDAYALFIIANIKLKIHEGEVRAEKSPLTGLKLRGNELYKKAI
jgi:hypothetical protein